MIFSERSFGSGGLRLSDVGEEEVLRRLANVALEGAPRLSLGPGDDAAVWSPPAGVEVALTQDALVEERDFRRQWISPRALGRRALAVALSDLAAMGAAPAWCMATLCAPADTEVEDVVEIQRGLVEAAADVECAPAGGDLSDTPGGLVIDVVAGGVGAPGSWLRRDSGLPGDALLVTGALGAAAAGLHVLMAGAPADAGPVAGWVEAWRAPRPRIGEGRQLTAAGVRCAGDVSDGLLVDAGRTAIASGCAAELWLDALPLASGVADAFPDRWPELALAWGEDFELLVAVGSGVLPQLLETWPGDLAPLCQVGRLVEGAGVALLTGPGGSQLPLPVPASRHWR